MTKSGRESARNTDAFLVGGGEMGERIRSFDWAGTPIGSPAGWSPVLRSTVSIMLANRFPLLLWWGPQYVSIYNDAYAPILGAKHPHALGQPVSGCWSEIWHILQPLIDRPFHGGPATWVEDLMLEVNRHGFLEEGHWTVAYSPVPDNTVESGIGGVLATVHEITEKVLGERRVQVLRDIGARPAEAKTAEEACSIATEVFARHPKDIPFALLYLLEPDGQRARQAGAVGVAYDSVASPPFVDLTSEASSNCPWPLVEAMRTETIQIVERLSDCLGESVPRGPWSDPPRQAVIVPIRSNAAHRSAGVLVAGVSSRLKLDEPYLGFYELLSSQIATTIANARAYEEERKRAEALTELDRAKTVFFSNVSHEFRTPLTLMLGPVEDLLDRSYTELSPATKGQLEIVHRNSLRLLKLVNTMLDFSRIEAGRMRANYEQTDLAAYTAELASNFQSACDRAGLLLTIHCPPAPVDSGLAYVDRDMWEKIVLNLLSNAFKFTFEGEIEVSLKEVDSGQWGVDSGRRSVTLRVRDTGVGIPPEELPRLFERFHRIKGAGGRTQEGTGIGLALVRELVKLHSGTVHVESEPGRGSTFTVSLPLGMGHLDPAHIRRPHDMASTRTGAGAFVEEVMRWIPGSAEGEKTDEALEALQASAWGMISDVRSSADQTRPRILWADDNADMRDYVARLLSERFEVVTAADGRAALDQARAMHQAGRPPDLILSDVMMPRLDGFGLLRALRDNPTTKTIPVILLSARAGEESRVEGLEQGADDYLIKPFSARELLARVQAHLDMARLRRESEAALRDSEARFRNMADTAPAMLWVTEQDGSCSFLSRGWYEFTGQNEQEGLEKQGMGWLDAVHAEDRERAGRVFQDANETRCPFSLEYRLRRHDGEYCWAIDMGRPRFGPAGEFLGYIGSVLDIGERKRAEDALRDHHRRIDLLARMGQELIMGAQNGPAALQSIIEGVGDTIGVELGFAYLIGEPPDTLRLVAANGLTDDQREYFSVIHVGEYLCGTVAARRERLVVENLQDSEFAEAAALRAAGVRWYAGFPLLAHGRMLGTIAFATRGRDRLDQGDLQLIQTVSDQTAATLERRRLFDNLRESMDEAERTARALRKSEERLRQFNEELERKVTQRTLTLLESEERLRALTSELNLAEQRERKRLATELHDHLQQMLVLGKLKLGQGKRVTQAVPAAAKLMQETDEVLSDALMYTRTLVAELSPPVLRDHGLPAGLKWLGEYMKKHDVTVTVTVPERPGATIPEDQAVLLFQSVRELLINSAKHAGTGEATVTMEEREGNLYLTVRDEGKGFDLAAADAETPSGGISSKYGLYSIQERMRALGGSFDIHSVPGQGTTMTLILPLAAKTPVGSGQWTVGSEAPDRGSFPKDAALTTAHSPLSTHEKPRTRVLLVDDHVMVRQGLRAVLDAYTDIDLVGEAINGEEAVRLVTQLRPAVVVMDINMPKMNGIEATEHIKVRYPETVVIGISVNVGDENGAAMRRAGAVTLLTKEAAAEQLHDAIQKSVKLSPQGTHR